ncbi:hypothetical protein [Stratiformator vulcanicus]|uniref:Bacterial type II secretion system protein I/J n=1 Tax=Stratiformator vulcanicus TaxID=2527980 RepID=A0A517R236_9PLAN|nr:hypothetical protein [Stratiformator vulcanicus]QDT37946.1 hypothetical protein Pan189_23290 [Stratiformator vulcanicus]
MTTSRNGLTLYEVVLALAIFIAALAAISQILNVGARSASVSRLRSEAIVRCDSKIAEVVAGVVPMQSVSSIPFEDDLEGRWTWSLELLAGPHPGLQEAVVTVEYGGGERDFDVDCELRRWIPIVDTAIVAAIASEAGR